ncbi:hypothetical protein A2533_02345 [Candidatus Falkowbacteria bacterium RIFOXYD2_FULL_35_9]|uniref:Uncharacterized protein n=1 Tax=Candidatus Falkowbacteria bacterium RIFOXYC2_FULL_36_12 TaxID=1798002 RepID=A0A1F5SW80_9BACT|nr:MAG: hypothetical protein A2300_04745 [Candidatus Falkowbacteria bacterium RIFOXYB2_FULL_35_7]OGF30988.1 MAG: hypothetical protein A2478_00925 [Candidatus Falkowbacteria bacterium RIFOXYC2_FULL_36_12]OGF34416.1 MAG: hypothetical protein A2223_02725 [Candidatus Falkowbacteria bacterium RIFOXYA2_FULL_35_8]OGF45638.1 MAG: hypothetical protein A2533_02345 [Candidatus Falkowbacteria bacterium RIFOXYD2_FULL_35_9]
MSDQIVSYVIINGHKEFPKFAKYFIFRSDVPVEAFRSANLFHMFIGGKPFEFSPAIAELHFGRNKCSGKSIWVAVIPFPGWVFRVAKGELSQSDFEQDEALIRVVHHYDDNLPLGVILQRIFEGIPIEQI